MACARPPPLAFRYTIALPSVMAFGISAFFLPKSKKSTAYTGFVEEIVEEPAIAVAAKVACSRKFRRCDGLVLDGWSAIAFFELPSITVSSRSIYILVDDKGDEDNDANGKANTDVNDDEDDDEESSCIPKIVPRDKTTRRRHNE